MVVLGGVAFQLFGLIMKICSNSPDLTFSSESLGYSANWLGRLPKKGERQFKAMCNDGFTGYQIPVRVERIDGSGSSIAKTISIRDFNRLLAYESRHKKNVKAIILLIAFSESGLERAIYDAFEGNSLDWFAEKIVHYSNWSYEDLEEVLEYNRQEVKRLHPWGSNENLPSLEPIRDNGSIAD